MLEQTRIQPRCAQDDGHAVERHAAFGFPQHASLVTAYAATMRANLLQGFPELSIPGAPTYLDKLDLFVNQALAGQMDAKVALNSAAGEWESLTDSLDRNAQRQAYLTWISTFHKAGIKY